MAFVSQELKAKLAPGIKAICKRYGIKASLAVRNHSTLVLNVRQGKIDFVENFNRVCSARPRSNSTGFQPARDHISVNPYWYQEHYTGDAKNFLKEVLDAMYGSDYFDDSDAQVDYFHCSHYVDVNIGSWKQPYQVTV